MHTEVCSRQTKRCTHLPPSSLCESIKNHITYTTSLVLCGLHFLTHIYTHYAYTANALTLALIGFQELGGDSLPEEHHNAIVHPASEVSEEPSTPSSWPPHSPPTATDGTGM